LVRQVFGFNQIEDSRLLVRGFDAFSLPRWDACLSLAHSAVSNQGELSRIR